jgi:hypothetical protein
MKTLRLAARRRVHVIAFGGLGLVLSATVSFGQVRVTTDTQACKLIPVAALEAHYQAKATTTRGTDSSAFSMCAVWLTDARHAASVSVYPPSPLTVEQRVAMLQDMMADDEKPLRSKGWARSSAFP